MRLTRVLTLIFAATILAVLSTAVAWARPKADAPNVVVLSNVQCEGEAVMDAVYSPAPQSIVGFDADGPLVGVAKSVEIELEPDFWVPVLERGVQGNPNTVECTWTAEGLNFRGQVLIARPSN